MNIPCDVPGTRVDVLGAQDCKGGPESSAWRASGGKPQDNSSGLEIYGWYSPKCMVTIIPTLNQVNGFRLRDLSYLTNYLLQKEKK